MELDKARLRDIPALPAFRLLAQGMKDKEAIRIVLVLALDPQAFESFNRWALEELEAQEKEDGV